jgi:hypothetical protein
LWLGENRARISKPGKLSPIVFSSLKNSKFFAGMAVTDVSKAAGAEWNKLTDKTKWEKLAAQDKVVCL